MLAAEQYDDGQDALLPLRISPAAPLEAVVSRDRRLGETVLVVSRVTLSQCVIVRTCVYIVVGGYYIVRVQCISSGLAGIPGAPALPANGVAHHSILNAGCDVYTWGCQTSWAGNSR